MLSGLMVESINRWRKIMDKLKISNRVIFGIVVIFIGIILLLNSMNVIDADLSLSTYWPMILILFGVAKIINYDESTFVGGIMLIIGIYFQLKNLNVEFFNSIRISTVFWPIVIILFGLSMIFESRIKKSVKSNADNHSGDSY
jgi:hypothetical protein